jgi:hypothetical protein
MAARRQTLNRQVAGCQERFPFCSRRQRVLDLWPKEPPSATAIRGGQDEFAATLNLGSKLFDVLLEADDLLSSPKAPRRAPLVLRKRLSVNESECLSRDCPYLQKRRSTLQLKGCPAGITCQRYRT